MDHAGQASALCFHLTRESAFSFKCQRCGACCSNKAIGLNPHETLRLSRFLGLNTTRFLGEYTEGNDAILLNRPDGSCVFLTASGCGVYAVRPLVCRLFPLGQLFDRSGGEKFACLPLHPDCLGLLGEEGTVASYLQSQGCLPDLYYESIYAWLAKKNPRIATLFGWRDVDALVDLLCRVKRISKPERPSRLLKLHLEALGVARNAPGL